MKRNYLSTFYFYSVMASLETGNIASHCLRFDGSRYMWITYTVTELFALRSSDCRPACDVLRAVHDVGLLWYRGSRAGQNQ